MTQQSILITGCSSGIGYAVAHGLKRDGYRVFASARKPADVQRLQTEGLECVQLDLDDSASIRTALEQVLVATGGTLDALFNNAAYGQPGAVEDLSREAIRAQFETNLFGTLELTNRVIPVMRRQGHGRIIQNSSVLGLAALPYRGAYNASKFALEGLTDTLRMELKGSGIAVSLIEPGPIESRFRANAEAAYRRRIKREGSAHEALYAALEQRLTNPGKGSGFTLPAEALLKPVRHALRSRRPKPRYYVTVPTHLFGWLRRFLSTRALDWVLLKSTESERRLP
ncbi:short-chain dehydrogenase [Alkalilimnicola ehrlichii]|uniref:Short-chain dehydrogenase n=1 Tax=Alkalilimnicola ehrlichii TaxID=351052 RepID=A0A3E0X1Q7_9GAMM|nr:SDR family oxidoreductase [Alkalilimnicola ehrlichii]RFA31310.1 short-chain dehydrogenase [Alkalilimnicola ehrlichii]RFA39417.1 short-chain dehydrogenase [Alkalilimnicola ehrlichii]